MSERPAPALVLSGPALETLEVLATGLLAPVDGYALHGEENAGWSVSPRLAVEPALAAAARAHGTLELRDPDTTPLAELTVTATAPAENGHAWIAGPLRLLRAPEHGPARGYRLDARTDLSECAVALFGGEVRPADVLRAVEHAAGRELALVFEGGRDAAATTHSVAVLSECADRLPDVIVRMIPETDLDAPDQDAARLVLAGRGARDVLDLRRESPATGSGAVVLLTGLSGSGKSTVARALAEELRARWGRTVVLLDGDHVRTELASELGFSARDRDTNLRRQAWVAARVAEAGGLAVCAPIAPFAATRAAMRAKVEPDHPFLVVHVATPLHVAEERDRKGLYAKARAGVITDFTGVDSPYEVPSDADARVDTSVQSVSECVQVIVEMLGQRGLITGD